MRNFIAFCVALLLTTGFAFEAAAVEPADALGDHMVLQRDKPVPIWGTAEPGEKVTVRFAGRSKTTVADEKGRWIVRLDPMSVNARPQELTIEGRSDKVTLTDILIGDVWIAGGQSNMGRAVNASWRPEDFSLDHPKIRYLKVVSGGKKYPSTELTPRIHPPRGTPVSVDNAWNVCEGDITLECAAVGFFFAQRVHEETGVPQGLLWNAWGGSVVREWIPQPGWWLRPEIEEDARKIDSWYPNTEIGRAAQKQRVEEIAQWCKDAREAIERGDPFPFPQPKLPAPDDGGGRGRGTTILYNGRLHPLVPYAVKGILWYQGESDYGNRLYRPMIESMVGAWRELFCSPDERPENLPFYFVQMQRCGSYMSPDVRDFQYQSYFTIENAGMAVLLDLDIQLHPWNKFDAGRRLARWSLVRDYGKKLDYSGPIYKSHRTESDRVVVEFEHARGGLFIGQKEKLDPVERLPDGVLVNLEITTDGRTWVPAKSKIEGERLVVWADGLKSPTDVRYCWKSIADGPFIYNAAALPAGQFNTQTIQDAIAK